MSCYNCSGGGWLHGCPDDMCRGCNEPEDCDYARLCPICLGEDVEECEDFDE